MKSNIYRRIMVLCLLVLFSATLTSAAFAEENAAVRESKIYRLRGENYIKSTDGAWRLAQVGDVIKQGDELFTGVNSAILMQLSDRSKVLVYSLTHLTFDQLGDRNVDQPGASRSGVRLGLSSGSISSSVTSSYTGSSFSISTPQGTASVRGTKKTVRYSPDMGMEVEVISGVVDVIDSLNRSITVTTGGFALALPSTGNVPALSTLADNYSPNVDITSGGITQQEARQLAQSFFDVTNLQYATQFFSDDDLEKL